jgi:methionyl-tRNA formyltransferase
VKSISDNLNILVLQPQNLKDQEFLEQVKSLNPDIFVVVAFRILPDELIAIPKHGAINLHASLLPKYRGAAPIQWALINGEDRTGVSIFKIDSGIDTGEIILQSIVAIHPEENSGELASRLSEIGAEKIVEALELIKHNKVKFIKQDSELKSSAPKITPEIQKLDWNNPAEKIVNLVRGLSPDNAPFTFINGIKLKIFRAKAAETSFEDNQPGTILQADQKNGLIVATANSAVKIITLQREGKKVLNYSDFLRGNNIPPGEILQ